ncbi:MAG: hypothetical protein GY720_04570 [bacterium]|nr:hypothetical protein [bacterium]
MPGRVRSVVYGAAAGALLGVVAVALWGSRASLGSVEGILIDPAAGRGRSDFMISSGWLYLAVILLAMLGGLTIAAIVYAFGRENEPDGARFPLPYLLPAAAVTAAIMAYTSLRFGLGATATIEAGTVTVSVFRLIIISVIVGLVAGGATASVVDALARPGFLGFEGEAVPSSPAAFSREMMAAIGAPTIALVVIAVVAVGLSQLLLSLSATGSVVAFSVAAALILGGAALMAYRPWEREA